MRRHLHHSADSYLVFFYSLFPLTVGAYLISLAITDGMPKNSSSFFDYLGFLTGIGIILLQLTMILRVLAPKSAATCMNWMLLIVAIGHFVSSVSSSIITVVFTGKENIEVAGISLATMTFSILPAFLCITSLMDAGGTFESMREVERKSSFASNQARSVVVIKRMSSDVMDSRYNPHHLHKHH